MAPTTQSASDSPRLGLETSRHQPGLNVSASKPRSQGNLPKPTQKKNMPRRSSKPIINWFQRKLAGTGKTKRVENLSSATELGLSKGRNTTTRVTPRVASSPLPSPALKSSRQHGNLKPDALGAAQRKTISLNDDDDARNLSVDDVDNASLDQSSLARESTWSPASALEADDDASLRPIPPSAPPSPSPSRSSSSYLSDPRTFRSIAASTKPTTLLSIDLNGNGMAHIAQAPMTPPPQVNRFSPHVRTSSSTTNPAVLGSGTSITFSALPTSPQSSSRHSSLSPSGYQISSYGNGAVSSVQAPLHTTHHPRNNPRPSSPPLDNASVLTLASSAYAIPGLRSSTGMPGYNSTAPSARGVGDSLSHFGGSITYADAESSSQFVLGDDDRLEERDLNASVRALRPRSSRRGSWESEASRWSARVQPGNGTPSLVRERSLWTSNSVRTGGFSAENADTYDQSDETGNDDEDTRDVPILETQQLQSLGSDIPDVDAAHSTSLSAVSNLGWTPKHASGSDTDVENVPPPASECKLSIDTVPHHSATQQLFGETPKVQTLEVDIPEADDDSQTSRRESR